MQQLVFQRTEISRELVATDQQPKTRLKGHSPARAFVLMLLIVVQLLGLISLGAPGHETAAR